MLIDIFRIRKLDLRRRVASAGALPLPIFVFAPPQFYFLPPHCIFWVLVFGRKKVVIFGRKTVWIFWFRPEKAFGFRRRPFFFEITWFSLKIRLNPIRYNENLDQVQPWFSALPSWFQLCPPDLAKLATPLDLRVDYSSKHLLFVLIMIIKCFQTSMHLPKELQIYNLYIYLSW